MPLSTDQQREIVLELLRRPKHEKVRSLVYRLLVEGLGASSSEIDLEKPLPEVRGRADALLGRTVFEFKSDLRRETRDAEEELSRYLAQREAETGEHVVGIATDGAVFVPYELRRGELRKLAPYTPTVDNPRELLGWLGAAVAIAAELKPEPETVKRELGRGSLAWHMAREELAALWAEVGEQPDVLLKRKLWAGLLERVYGSPIDDDDLFFQHTYLTTVAKTMALHVLGLPTPDARHLLSGEPFKEAGILGVVESDFFDWLLDAKRGADLVGRISAHAARFRLRDVEMDVLKGLYESLIDPGQRHDLGEYYTPDWLASKMCERVIEDPLRQRVLDPACGSGTFLFHAVRRYLAASEVEGKSNREALEGCCAHVRGVDIHPVAAQIARVTYVLALGEERLRGDRGQLAVPVYLGDSLQWNTAAFMGRREVKIPVPEEAEPLEFPFGVAQDPGIFDAVIDRMMMLGEADAEAEALTEWLQGVEGLDKGDIGILARTYEHLRELKRADRNHIWGFVARNLVRPAWLSRTDERADVIVGNPPWLAYRHMSRTTQEVFKKACQERGIWAGGKVATHQDLSAYFFARCVELYFLQTGVIAFVMPYASMSRRQFEGFRKGIFGRPKARGGLGEDVRFLRFVEAWAFPDDVQPLFPVPSCVLIGEQRSFAGSAPVLPETVLTASGHLPRRDATLEEAERALKWREAPWPAVSDEEGGSPYRELFKNGATVFPRMLCVVDRVPSPIGGTGAAPVVESRRRSQEKMPWKGLPPLRGNVEAEFLRPLYLGESVAPFRLLDAALAVIPWDDRIRGLIDAGGAQRAGHVHLAAWLQEAESLWEHHGRGGTTFIRQLDYFGKLTAQFPVAPLRVLFGKAGTLPAAALLLDRSAIVENTLYWAKVDDEKEARFLCAVLNSETARGKVAGRQATGQWGARHFDKVMFELPIPKFDSKNRLHRQLAEAAARAEEVAAAVTLPDGEHFVRSRQRIRAALAEDGIAQRMDGLVEQLLAG